MEATTSLATHVVGGHLLLPFHRVLVETLRELGDRTAARSVVDEVRRRSWGEGHAAYLVPLLAAGVGTYADAAAAARAARRPDEARMWVSLAADLAAEAEAAVEHQVALPPCAVALAVARAELARAVRRPDDGAWAEIALSWERLGDDYRRAQALLRKAECHLAARRRRPAAQVLTEARRTAEDLGAASLVAAVHSLATRAGLPSDEPTREPRFHLTRREREVLNLLARGLTDRQIGAQLFISHRTVERHVSSILAKLNARTRAEVTAIAHRDRLVPHG
jgi:DNA-binding CsgD family transcriptional regulator